MIDFNQCNPELLSQLIEGRQVKDLRELFDEMNIVDLADIVAELTVEEILFLFKTLRKDISAQLFTYLPNEVKADMISSFTSGQIKSMIETLYTDDLVDFLQDLPANVIRQILKEADHEQRITGKSKEQQKQGLKKGGNQREIERGLWLQHGKLERDGI